ncbi:MAG: T9SS type A sorting domain-containing protein [Salibacteraceae bacterium]
MRTLFPVLIFLFSFGWFNTAKPQSIEAFDVYPNPVVDVLTVNYKVNLFTRLDLDLYNVIGKKVWSPLSDSIHWPGTYQISYDASPLQNGVYFLTLMDQSGEKNTVRFVKNSPVSIAETTNNPTIIYPNPSTGWVVVPDKTKELNVFDFSGKQVLSESNPSSPIDVSKLKNGIYIFELVGAAVTKELVRIQK